MGLITPTIQRLIDEGRRDPDGLWARAAGDPESLPVKAPRAAKPLRRGVAFWAMRGDGALLLRRRPERGLLGGMAEVPSTEWRKEAWTQEEALASAPFAAEWRALPGGVGHVFTHFPLELTVLTARIPARSEAPEGMRWVARRDLEGEALPGLMRKVLAHGLGELSPWKNGKPSPARKASD